MKTLTLIRHAKSSWDFDVDDRESPLSQCGMREALSMAERLKSLEKNYDMFFSGPAKRAWDTCSIISSGLGFPSEKTKIANDLYDFDGRMIQNFVHALPDSLQSVVIFGHNPAFTGLSNLWGSIAIPHVPTCGVVCITFKADHWKDIKKGETDFFWVKD